jgi:hypothetical protein
MKKPSFMNLSRRPPCGAGYRRRVRVFDPVARSIRLSHPSIA